VDGVVVVGQERGGLTPVDVVVGSEVAVRVAVDDAVGRTPLDLVVEDVGGRDVGEGLRSSGSAERSQQGCGHEYRDERDLPFPVGLCGVV
jgi:hypothetical protein